MLCAKVELYLELSIFPSILTRAPDPSEAEPHHDAATTMLQRGYGHFGVLGCNVSGPKKTLYIMLKSLTFV